MSVSEKMTAIATDIRGINGVSNTLGLDDMHNQLSATQETVDSQKNIIEQIRTALQGKVAAVPALQEKTVTPTEEQQIILPDSGFDGLSKVIVEAMESNASSIFTATTSLSSRNQTITFNDLPKEPIAFAIIPTAQVTLATNNRYVVNVVYDGATTHGIYAYGSGSTYRAYYSNSYFTTTYSNGTLTVKTSSTSNGGYFINGVNYMLVAIFEDSNTNGGNTTIQLQEKTVTPSASEQSIIPDNGYDGLSQVIVEAIPSDYTRVRTINGTGTTNSSGDITINCGFTPDLVSFYFNNYEMSYPTNATIDQIISFDIRNMLNDSIENITGTVAGFITGTTDTGASFHFQANDSSYAAYANKTMHWIAVEYSKNASGEIVSNMPSFTYSGEYQLIEENSNNWQIKLKTTGNLVFSDLGNASEGVDVFLVGGGGAGTGYGGGGGGYTKTATFYPQENTTYQMTIGAGATTSMTQGGTTSAFNNNVSVEGGHSSTYLYTQDNSDGGNGGSGGGGSGDNINDARQTVGGNGGSNGGNGGDGRYINSAGDTKSAYSGGQGQRPTTRAFGESNGELYAGGGGGNCNGGQSFEGVGGEGGGGAGGGYNGTINTGGGGGGGGGQGGSGIIIIRNKRG